MKKLLLFALSLGLGTISYAQTPTQVSVDAFVSPTGTVFIDGSGTGAVLTKIEVTITNNDANGVNFAAGSTFNYNVKLDGTKIDQPVAGGTTEWGNLIAQDINANTSHGVTLTNSWAASTQPGSHEICVSLERIVVSVTPFLYDNQDANKELCQDFTFDWATSVADLSRAEISSIKTHGDVMTVTVKNTNQQVQINILNITGQTVKTVIPSAGGQNFYQDIDISDLTSGVYIVTIQTENGVSAAQKVFVQ